MKMLDNAIIISLIVLAFIAGMKLANHYNQAIENVYRSLIEPPKRLEPKS